MAIIIPTGVSTYADATSTGGHGPRRKYVLAQFRSDSNLEWVRELRSTLVHVQVLNYVQPYGGREAALFRAQRDRICCLTQKTESSPERYFRKQSIEAALVRDELKYRDFRAARPRLRQDANLWSRVENGVGQATIVVIDPNQIPREVPGDGGCRAGCCCLSAGRQACR